MFVHSVKCKALVTAVFARRCVPGKKEAVPRLAMCPVEVFDGLCGSRCFQSSDEVCCAGVIQPRSLGNECCGTTNYKPSESMCCNGVLHKVRQTGRGDEHSIQSRLQCCGQEV